VTPWRGTSARAWPAQGLRQPAGRPRGGARDLHPAAPEVGTKDRWAPDKKPDLDKLARALLDALTMGGAVIDDAQVVDLAVSKVYPVDGNLPGVTFTIAPAERGEAVAA
jgi:hypothetical protein